MRHGAVRLLDAESDITAAGGDTIAEGLAALALRVAEQPLPRRHRDRADSNGHDPETKSNTKRPLVAVLEDTTPQELADAQSELLQRGWDDAHLVVHVREPTPDVVDAFVEAGARAVVAQESPGATLCRATREAVAGQIHVDRAGLRLPLQDRRRPHSGPSSLTPQELRVVRLLPAGRSNLEIANELDVSVHTVRTHMRSAFVKLGAANRVAAARIAVRERLVQPDELEVGSFGLHLATDQPIELPVPTPG